MQTIILGKENVTGVIMRLKRGGVVAYPSETVYGLGCDATNKQAVAKIFAIKGRAAGKALPVLAASVTMLKKYFVLNDATKKLLARCWPGPLTVILNFNKQGRAALQHINANRPDGAVRISCHPLAAALVKKLGRPLVSTSANPTGRPPALDSDTVAVYFKNKKYKPDIIIEGGSLKKSKGSTIVDVRDGSVTIVRQGDLVIDDL